VERYLTGYARKGAHAGYGKQWIETLKAAIEVIANPFNGIGEQRRDCPERGSEVCPLRESR
jgi:hypothetical protein